jgi:hypothetical protein
MKQHYVPIEKQSKRKQKEFNSKQRRDWGILDPKTKKSENGKAYNRKKSKHLRYGNDSGFGFFILGRSSKYLHTFII